MFSPYAPPKDEMTNVLVATSGITKLHDIDAQIAPTTYEMPMNALIVTLTG